MELLKYLVEFLGTFVFLSVILMVGKPIPIVVTLLAMIYLGGSISGGHFNPAVSVMMFLKKTLSRNDMLLYILAQVLGGFCALHFYKLVEGTKA